MRRILLCASIVSGLLYSEARYPQLPTTVTQGDVNRWKNYWQQQLQLGKWTVSVKIVRIDQLKPHTLGNLRWDEGTMAATIKVLDPQDYDYVPDEIPQDIEYTVMHELIHLKMIHSVFISFCKGREEAIVNQVGDEMFFEKTGGKLYSHMYHKMVPRLVAKVGK